MAHEMVLGAATLLVLIVGFMTFVPGVSIFAGRGSVSLSDGTSVKVTIADTDARRAKGLSGRDVLDENEGMLFLFPGGATPYFWMKDMKFAIDIIWIQSDVVVGFDQNVQSENPPVTYYYPTETIDRVLEVQAGFVQKHGLKVGDQLDIRLD